jgi:type I restriction enzyme, S subunit
LIAALQPYPEYKDLELPWLGDLPAHWKVVRAKYLFRETDERSKRGKEELLSVSHLTGVTPRSQKNVTMFLAKSNVGHKICRPSDVVINTMWAWMGALGVAKDTGIVSPAYGVYRPLPNSGVQADYSNYLLRSAAYSAEYQRRSTGVNSSRLRLYPEQFLGIPVPVPSPDEQLAIVRFLDWANGRLERAIRAKRKVIALLNEQKQAIIHRAVTRGLDPSVPLKPSGIAWLSHLPQHWEVRRLKSLVKEAVAGPYGSSLTKSMYTDIGYRVYGQQQVIPDDFTVGDYYISKDQFREMQRYQVFAGDVLVSVMGTVGKVAVVPESAEPGIINPRLVRYRPDTAVARPRWLQLAMQDLVAQSQLSEASKGTTMEGLNMRILGQLLLTVPPLGEQDAILEHVSRSRQPFTYAINRLEREIELLREYRTRLVADVVTGKLDVREAAAHLPEETTPSPIEDITGLEDEPALPDEEAAA